LTAGRGRLPPVLVRFWVAMAAVTAASVAYTAVRAHVYGLTAPWGLPVFWDENWGDDFLVFRAGFAHFGRSDFWSSFAYPFTYPAPTGVVFAVLYRVPHPMRSYLTMLAAALVVGLVALVLALVRRGVSLARATGFGVSGLAMIWPVYFLISTGNIEGFMGIVLAAGVAAVIAERWQLGAALIGIAAAMKIFPFVLLGLLVARRKYGALAFGVAVAVAVTLVSLKMMGPTMVEAQRHIDAGLALVKARYFFSMADVAPLFDHSLWMPVRFAAVGIVRPATAARTLAVLNASLIVYLAVTAVAGVALFFVRIRRLPVLNQVLALTVCAVLLPPLSLEYTLVHLLLPFGLLCVYAAAMWQRGVQVAGLGACLLCFVPIFNVDSFLNQRHLFATEARMLGLIVLLVLALKYRFAWPEERAL
jgi:hypothetical protein